MLLHDLSQVIFSMMLAKTFSANSSLLILDYDFGVACFISNNKTRLQNIIIYKKYISMVPIQCHR